MKNFKVTVVSEIPSRLRLKLCLWLVRFAFWVGGFNDIEVTYHPYKEQTKC